MGPSADGLLKGWVRGGGVRRRLGRISAGALACAALVAAGVLTHCCVHPGRLTKADQSPMRMQRMGPPSYLQAAYEQLSRGAVAIRDSSTGRVVATGIYAASSLELARLPAAISFLPTGLKHMLALGASYNYSALFIAPLRYIRTRTVRVDTSALQLPGVVVRTNKALGLAAVVATVSQDQLSGLDTPPPLLAYPLSAAPLRLLILRRNPDYGHRSAGFVLTSGLSAGRGWCDTPVSGAGSGAPLGYVSPSGRFFLAGLAMPSPAPGRCSILGAWNLGEFVALVNEPSPSKGGRAVAFLGVSVESTAAARAEGAYGGHQQGAYVTSVGQESPAGMAGLLPGDVIIRIGAEQVSSLATLRAALHRFRPNTIHLVTFMRDEIVHTIPVMLAAIPAADDSR
jgi:hypothetical protein